MRMVSLYIPIVIRSDDIPYMILESYSLSCLCHVEIGWDGMGAMSDMNPPGSYIGIKSDTHLSDDTTDRL